MKHLIRILLGIAITTALIGAASATEPLAAKAEAATYVSTTYTAPKRGQTNAGVKALQRRLIKAKVLGSRYATGYYGPLTANAVKKFQRKYRLRVTGKVDRRTWSVLVKKTGKIKIGSSSRSKIPARCKTKGRVLCIDKTKRKLYFVQNGTIRRSTDARFGCSRTPTRNGTFRVFRKNRHWVSTIYHSPMPFSMFFSGGQAVHYSSDFARRGYRGCSHGCVNIRNWSTLEWIYNRVRVGDKVVVYWS
jgi:lipoprotein-anchoring transpeptidase ErfK/SrfK